MNVPIVSVCVCMCGKTDDGIMNCAFVNACWCLMLLLSGSIRFCMVHTTQLLNGPFIQDNPVRDTRLIEGCTL